MELRKAINCQGREGKRCWQNKTIFSPLFLLHCGSFRNGSVINCIGHRWICEHVQTEVTGDIPCGVSRLSNCHTVEWIDNELWLFLLISQYLGFALSTQTLSYLFKRVFWMAPNATKSQVSQPIRRWSMCVSCSWLNALSSLQVVMSSPGACGVAGQSAVTRLVLWCCHCLYPNRKFPSSLETAAKSHAYVFQRSSAFNPCSPPAISHWRKQLVQYMN